MPAFVEIFNSYTSTLRNIIYVFSLIGAGWALYIGTANAPNPYYVVPLTVTSIFAICFLIYASHLRRKVERFYSSLDYIHRITHEIRDVLDLEGAAIDNSTDEEKSSDEEDPDYGNRADAALKGMLTGVLDNAQQCFTALTGHYTTAVLIMPQQTESDGFHFKSYLYSSNCSEDRKRVSLPIHGGLVKKAFEADSAKYFSDYAVEMASGGFVVGTPKPNETGKGKEPLKWYRSGIMAHFKVGGVRYGVLCVDSPVIHAFRERLLPILAGFSDACALAFVLADFGVLGNVSPTTED
jgi:hypothetical protein